MSDTLDDLARRMRGIGQALQTTVPQKAMRATVVAITELMTQELRARAPRRTGRFAESIYGEAAFRAKGVTLSWYGVQPPAIFLREGTKMHKIQPVHAKALRFELDGSVVFAKRVWHPGTKPHPFIAEAAAAVAPRLREIAKRETLEAAREALRKGVGE